MTTPETYKQAKESHYHGVVYGIPTFGMMSRAFLQAQWTMAVPIFCNVGYHTVVGKPVDVARNEIAFSSIINNQAYVFFRDDDVIAPRDALIKMLERLPMHQRTNPGEVGDYVIGGVVYSKVEPPLPMIHVDGHSGAYQDWELGDLIEVDVIGMGCTIIPTGVFRKVLPHVTFYQCVNHRCPTNWKIEYKEDGNCPSCRSRLVPGFFKTVRDLDDDGNPAYLTEDSYFLLKAKKAGVKTLVDCGVQCQHEAFHPDPDQCKYYYFHPGLGPCWQMGESLHFIPRADAEKTKQSDNYKKRTQEEGPVKFNIGSGGEKRKGYVNIDLHVQADFQCDIRDLSPALAEYGRPIEIRACHVIEHLDRNHVMGALRGWIRALEPGGVLEIETPDMEWVCQNFVNYASGDEDLNDFPEMIIYGLQTHPGEYHHTAMYEKRLKALLSACEADLKEWSVEKDFPEKNNQQVLRVRAVKRGDNKRTETEGHDTVQEEAATDHV